MSLILKGIDMPKVNETRMIAITSNGVAFFNTIKDGEKSKSEKAQAIQILAPHGRLIDEDDLINELTELQDLNLESIAPTILEAEE